MEFESCFDIIGPIMVGPSSSHTAGVVSIGKFVHELLDGCPEEADIIFYDSFAETYQGHGTDKALLGGLLGMNTDDSRIKHAIEMTHHYGLTYGIQLEGSCPYYDHPNTTFITARSKDSIVKVGGVSLGGGLSKIFMINGELVDIRLSTNDDISTLATHFSECVKKDTVLKGVV
ncbi:L-serine dehydratase [Evansella vedderi]|uniref:L-serine ammonia-lyase n=1 Tax=Evansella vedderi TaxID=38282 RepID=A0ABT9ZYS0_9BACI|nr:serine dehydratase beta chain [Evansella vedderi]MDQ0256401.1 L-serine dehydratase [Evansella vedderi]